MEIVKIHKVEDIMGRYWAFVYKGEEFSSCCRPEFTFKEAKERAKKVAENVLGLKNVKTELGKAYNF